jgi:oxygen-independent coproporphyrinogen III oxidase
MAGIYLHIPYCKRACHYCNFHFSTSLKSKNDFVSALLKELELRRDYLEGERVETIYFGGGTPSLLEKNELDLIMESLYNQFPVAGSPEITLEANPDDISREKLENWKSAGINRLSIGVQSFFGEDLVWMNRAHDAAQAMACIENAQAAGFTNLSIDLIYGLPYLTDDRWQYNVEKAIALGIAHLSCYALTVEPRTALYKMIERHQTSNTVPEDQARQFLLLTGWLESAGYEHYEISSFAKPGKRSIHNTAYWRSQKYLGAGPAAHSYNGLSRQWNIANNAIYIESIGKNELPFERELLKETDILNEYIMTALRTKEGIDLEHVAGSFGADAENSLQKNAARYIENRQMKREHRKLVLTPEGKLFADGIASALFF